MPRAKSQRFVQQGPLVLSPPSTFVEEALPMSAFMSRQLKDYGQWVHQTAPFVSPEGAIVLLLDQAVGAHLDDDDLWQAHLGRRKAPGEDQGAAVMLSPALSIVEVVVPMSVATAKELNAYADWMAARSKYVTRASIIIQLLDASLSKFLNRDRLWQERHGKKAKAGVPTDSEGPLAPATSAARGGKGRQLETVTEVTPARSTTVGDLTDVSSDVLGKVAGRGQSSVVSNAGLGRAS